MAFKEFNKPQNIEISMSDVIRFTHYGEKDITNLTIPQRLHLMGMDVKKRYSSTLCKHRNGLKEVVTCERFVGTERTDSNWLKLKLSFKNQA